MGETKLKRVGYYIKPEQFEQLQKLSANTGATVSEILRRAVNEYLDKHLKAEG